MQDTSAGFDLAMEYHLPWEQRLLILYLLVVLLFALVRAVRLTWTLHQTWRITKSESSQSHSLPTARAKFLHDWRWYVIKVESLRKAAVMTFLLSVLAFLYTAVNGLRELSVQRQIGMGALGGEGAELLTSFAVAVAVCTILYAAYGFLEGAMARKKAAWDDLQSLREGDPTK